MRLLSRLSRRGFCSSGWFWVTSIAKTHKPLCLLTSCDSFSRRNNQKTIKCLMSFLRYRMLWTPAACSRHTRGMPQSFSNRKAGAIAAGPLPQFKMFLFCYVCTYVFGTCSDYMPIFKPCEIKIMFSLEYYLPKSFYVSVGELIWGRKYNCEKKKMLMPNVTSRICWSKNALNMNISIKTSWCSDNENLDDFYWILELKILTPWQHSVCPIKYTN